MEKMSLGCQVCCAKFRRMFEIKKHMCSKMHQTKMKEIFKKEKFNNFGFPSIVMMNPQTHIEMKQPIVGLSLLTLCFSPELKIFFYLCHVCEEKCFPKNIVAHLSSSDHCSNYFNYKDPDVLSFSWIPGLDMRDILRHEITKVTNKPETRRLQLLDLPADLLKKLDSRTYSEVIRSLSENDKLVKLFKAVKPKRTMIQKYQTDSNRKHPLLGMQHIVECISVGPTERRHYLCTLCKLTLAPHVIIKHVLSFDHIYCYFREWHPSTLLSKESYTAHTTLTIMILDLAKQTLEIHATTNTDMKQVRLEPDEFTSVNFTCYSDALDQLESIRQKKKENSLITVPTPGKKLESHSGLSLLSIQIYCQDCGSIFDHVSPFSSHLKSWHHQQTVKNTFGKDSRSDGYEPIERTPYLKLYSHLRDKRKQTRPAVGVSLVVTFISSEVQVEPICVCFACSDCFMESSVIQHLNSQKHIIHTLLYLNPWRLPLAWKNVEDVRDLWSAAWSEDREREPDHMTMKILDIPYWMFEELFPPSYSKVTMTLTNYNTFLKREVPKCETFSKLKENERFPLLGRQFMAMHYLYDRLHQPTEVAFLCMLCRRRLSDQECHAHVFSREHITLFINHFHPGSMTSKTDLETILDLAKQAERHHSTMNVQEIQLDRSIREPCSYKTAYFILANAKLRKGHGKLLPNIFPKQKLVPRATLKDKDVVRDNSLSNSGMLPGSEKKSCQKSPDNCKKTRVGAEITDEKCAERGGNEEEEVDIKHLKSEQHAVETCTEDTKSPVSETLQAIKEEEIEERIVCKPSEEKTESCKYRDVDLKSEITEQSNKNTQTHSMNNACKEETTRPVSMCKESQGAFCYEDMEENTSCKKGLPAPKQDASCEVKQRLPISIQKKETAADVKGRETKPSQQSVKHEGLSALLECHCDQRDLIYLCECCSMKIPEKDIISHVTGYDHQKTYLSGLKPLPSPPGTHQGMTFCHFAALLEKHSGYGEAQVMDLEKEIYNNVLKQNFKSAMQTVKALQAQQGRVSEPSSTSALSNSQPVDTSFSPQAQNEASNVLDNCQVVAMEFDGDSEDSEARSSSVTSSERAEAPPDSSENAKLNLVKESALAYNVYSCQTVTKSSEETSNIYVSTNGTKSTCAHPDSTGKPSKAGVISNTNISLIKEETTLNIVGTSECAEKSNAVVTNSIKSTTAISAGQVKVSCSAPDSIKKTAITPFSKLTANTTSCSAVTTSKSGATVYKCAPSTFSSTTTVKSTIAKSHTSSTTTTSVAPDYSCTTTNSNIGESGYKCVTSISSSNAKTTKLTAVNFNTGMTTNTTAAPSKSGTATSIKRRETAHTSMSSTSAMTTKSTAANFNTSITTSTSAASINSASTTNNSKTANTSSVGANTTKSNRANPYTSTTASPSAALTNSGTTTTTNRRENDFKYTSNKSINNTETPKSASDFLKPGTISTSNLTTSSESETTTSGEVSKPLQSRTSSTKVKHKANIASIVQETPLHTKVNSQPTATTSVKCGNTEASDKTALMKKSVGSNADVAPDKHNRPAPKTTKIGVDQMIVVLSGKRRQLYCQLCAARLTCSDHPSTYRHKLNYVKMKLPHWTAEPSELKSKLANTVALCVELEQCAGAPKIQKLEVTMDVYDELKNLDDDKALARVTEMKRERDSGVSSATADPGQVSTPDAHLSSPFDSSPVDETDLWQNETAGLSPEIQSVQESKHELQTSLVKIAVRQNQRLEEFDVSPQAEVTPEAVEKTPGNSTLTCEFESASPFAEGSSCPETREQRNHQEKSDPELLVTQKVLEGSENTSPVNCSNPDELSSAPSVNAEQHDQPRPRQKAEEASEQSRCGSRPDHHSVLQPLPNTSGVASLGCSNLSTYLAVKNLDSELIIGRGSVWECRGISQTTFFLCESCSERLFLGDICQHMISVEHWLNHLLSKHPNIMTFWSLEDVTQKDKMVILKAIVRRTSEMERFPEIDAKSKLLPPKEFEYVKTAPFSEALKFLQDSEKEQNPSIIYPPISTPQQKEQPPEKQQDQVESVPTEMKSAQVSETDERRDCDMRQETENQHVDGVKKRRVSSPLDETSVYSRADSVVVPFPEAGTCQSPQENSKCKQEVRPLVDGQHQRAITELQMKQTEVQSGSSSSSVIGAKTSPALPESSGDKCPLARKRPADTSVETLARSCNSNTQLEDPFPDKSTNSSLQPKTKSASESTPVHPPATPTPLSAEDKKSGPVSKEPNSSIVDITLNDLIALVKETRSGKSLSPCVVKSETLSPCPYNLSAGVKIKRELEFEHITPAMPEKKKRLDSKVELDKSTDKTMLPSGTLDCPIEPQSQESMSPSKPGPNDEAANYHPEPRANPEPDSQLPISPIITPRLDPSKPQLTGHYFARGYTKNSQDAHSFPTVANASQSDTQAASSGYAQTSQMPYTTNGYSFLPPSGAVGGLTTPAYPSAYNQSSYQGNGYGTTGNYQSHFKTEQGANYVYLPAFEPCSATSTPLGWASCQMPQLMQQQQPQQQQMMVLQQQQQQQQQQMIPQQQLIQQQYWRMDPPPIHNPPTANSQILTQASANSSSWFFPGDPIIDGDMPPVAQGTFSSTK